MNRQRQRSPPPVRDRDHPAIRHEQSPDAQRREDSQSRAVRGRETGKGRRGQSGTLKTREEGSLAEGHAAHPSPPIRPHSAHAPGRIPPVPSKAASSPDGPEYARIDRKSTRLNSS